MSDRTALIISCTEEQAAAIHQRAELERRTISAYVLHIVMRWLNLEDRLLVMQHQGGQRLTAYQPVRPPGKRTTILLRCTKKEAHRIRAGAKRRCTTISWFVLYTLSLSWSAGDSIRREFLNQ